MNNKENNMATKTVKTTTHVTDNENKVTKVGFNNTPTHTLKKESH